MVMKTRSLRHILLGCLTQILRCAMVLAMFLLVPSVVLAQVAAPQPVVPAAPSVAVAVVTVLALVIGFINQGIGQGSVLGIVTVPKPWLPYLTLAASFLGGVVASLAQDSVVNGAAIWGAVVAGVTALLAAGGGAALSHHVSTPAKTLAAQGGSTTTGPEKPPTPPAEPLKPAS